MLKHLADIADNWPLLGRAEALLNRAEAPLGRAAGLLGLGPPPPVLGLDISSTSVKLLELSRLDATGRSTGASNRARGERAGCYRVEGYGAAPLPPGAVIEKTVKDAEGVSRAIRSALRESGTRPQRVAAAVAGSSVITRLITMPSGLSEEELETQIILEAGQHIPYPLEDVAIDFEVQGPSPEGGGQVEVLLAACRRETIAGRVAAIEGAELKANIIDVESCAMERACGLLGGSPYSEEGIIAVVDIGAATTALSVLSGGRGIYSREQLFGGGQLVGEIMRRYGLSATAADLARQRGELPDDYEPEVLEPFRDAVVRQVARSLQLFFSSSPYNDVDHILMAGGVSSMPGLAERVQERLGTPVAVANPFAGMAISPGVNGAALRSSAPALMIACGLALRSFD